MINRSPFAAASSQRGRTHTATIRPRSLLRLLARATRRVREQAANQDRARLIAHFAALEHSQVPAWSVAALRRSLFAARMIAISRTPKRYANGTACHLAPVLLVVAWGVAWIGFHALQHVGAHTLFQTLALAESVIALLLRRRKPGGALAGILIAYFAFQLDPLLLPPLLIALITVAAVGERRTVLLATAATATAVAALPLTGRASIDFAGYLLRLLGVAGAAAIGLRAQTHTPRKTP